MLQQLDRRGCTLIDTTCGSVLNVWKNVRRYAEGGYTSVIHGKVGTRKRRPPRRRRSSTAAATSSCSIDAETADRLRLHPAAAATATRSSSGSRKAASPGFDPDRDLQRIGLANQTTMLMSESLEIGEMLKAAMLDRYGDAGARPSTFRPSTRSAAPPRIGRTPCVALLRDQAGRPDDRDRRLQQQQHLQPGAHLRRVAADLPHRRSRLPGLARARSAIGRSAAKREVTTATGGCPRRARRRRPDVGGLDARQPGRRRHRAGSTEFCAGPTVPVKSCLPLNGFRQPAVS